ncbi:MAG: DNA polymerase III subunit, partial [Chloroflexota bacterium]|nr:DNA polymerase III subunit [Chloroflexota bacterium]
PEMAGVLARDTPSPPPSPNGWSVWGHDEAVDGLRRAVARNHVSHAYLVAGPDGVGKGALATGFARAICCQDDRRPDPSLPCGVCLACRKIARGVHPDVETFGLASQAALADKDGRQTSLTIETVRRLSAAIALRPMEARRRVVVVEDAESMQEVAQEALLKTLEEPPPSVVILLLAADSEALLPTIRSRCRPIELHPVPRPVVAAMLAATGTDAGRVEEIAALAAGRPGWALRAAADPALITAWRDGVERAMTWIGAPAYDRLVTAVRLGDNFSKRRPEVFADLGTLLGVWRDALLLRADLPHYLTYRGYADRLSELARGWELESLRRAVCAVQTCIADLEANVRPRLAIEAMVLQWPTSSRHP